MKVIGFCAKAGHGKDTCASIVAEALREEGKVVAHWAFGNSAKATIYGEEGGAISFEDLWENKPANVRRLLQTRATEQGRDLLGPYLWVLQTEAILRLFETHIGVDVVVISDVRFPNEADFILGGGVAVFPNTVRIFEQKMQEYAHLQMGTEEERSRYLDLEMEKWVEAHKEVLATTREGKLLFIESDRDTLTGKAAKHSSETLVDKIRLKTTESNILTNNKDTTLDDLRKQLAPVIDWALD